MKKYTYEVTRLTACGFPDGILDYMNSLYLENIKIVNASDICLDELNLKILAITLLLEKEVIPNDKEND